MRNTSTLILTATLAIGILGTAPGAEARTATDWEQAVAAYKAGNNADAIAAFTDYVERVPTAYQGHQMLGTVLLRSGDAAKAAAHLARADALEPNQPAILLTLGKALIESNAKGDACTVLGRINAADLDARFSRSLLGLKTKAECSGDRLADLHRLATTANSAQGWASYGVEAYRAGDLDVAVEALNRAGALEPNDARVRRAEAKAMVARAMTFSGSARTAALTEALTPAKVAFEADPSKSTTELYAEALIGAGELADAATVLDSAIEAAGDNWKLNYLRGRVFLLEENYTSAESPLTTALAAATTTAETTRALEQLGFTYEMQRRFDEAISTYRRAGAETSAARVETNRTIAMENVEADAFNQRLDELVEQKRLADAELDKIRAGGPPPTSD